MPRGKRAVNNEKKVRMMLPMSVRCNTCGNFMYKGTKFNCRMEDVAGETYLVGWLKGGGCGVWEAEGRGKSLGGSLKAVYWGSLIAA